jgi:hypothetical protein
MNKRIRLLAEQAGMTVDSDYSLYTKDFTTYGNFVEKFAQLIVEECIQAIQNEGQTYEHLDAGEFQANNFSQAVKQHFGVEE